MPDLNEEILKLKSEGLSLRQIASALRVSHEAVRKRLKNLANKQGQMSTKAREHESKPLHTDRGVVSTFSNAHKSKASRQPRHTVNRVSTEKTPCPTITESVNPLETLAEQPTEGKKGVSQEVCSRIDDLFGAIKDFLESKGIEVYRMQNGGYQVKGNREIVRFYITRQDSIKEGTG